MEAECGGVEELIQAEHCLNWYGCVMWTRDVQWKLIFVWTKDMEALSLTVVWFHDTFESGSVGTL